MARDSKVMFCGDLTQVDNPYISPFGGVAALIEKFKGSQLFGHVTLERSVRSRWPRWRPRSSSGGQLILLAGGGGNA